MLKFEQEAALAISHLLDLIIEHDSKFVESEKLIDPDYIRDPDTEWWADYDFLFDHPVGVVCRYGLFGIGEALFPRVGIEKLRDIAHLAAGLDADNYARRLNVIGWAWDGVTKNPGEIIAHSAVTFAPSRKSQKSRE